MKPFYIFCGVLAVVVGFFMLQTKFNTWKIDSAFKEKKYAYFCVAHSYDIQHKNDQTYTIINNNKIDLDDLWPSYRMDADGSYAVIFTNDLKIALNVNIADTKLIQELSKQKPPYCQEIKQ